MKKIALFLIGFLAVYFLLLNVYGEFELGHDQARHANNGALWYYYFNGYNEKSFASFDEFIGSFPEFSRSKIAWYLFYDPPFHPILTAISYNIFGINEFAARLPTQLLSLFGIVITFLLAKEYTSEKNAVLIAMTVSFVPLIFHIGRDAMTDSAAAFLLVGWFYSTFFLSKHNGWKRKAAYFLGALFLSAAVMTKYTSIFFWAVFSLLFFMYQGIYSYRTQKIIVNPDNKRLFMVYAVQVLILFCTSYWWISASWVDAGILEKLSPVRTENWTQHGYLYNVFYLFWEFAIETVGIIFLLVIVFFSRKSLEQKHFILIFYLIGAFFVVPIIFTNIQPRYFLSLLPLLLILIFNCVEKRFSEKKAQRIFICYIILFLGISLSMSYLVYQANGEIHREGFDEIFSKIRGQGLFFNYYGNFDTVDIISGPNVLTVKSLWQYWYAYIFRNEELFQIELKQQNHYYNPDSFMFRMLQQLEDHPRIGFVYLSAAELDGIYGEDVLQIMNTTKNNFPTYFVVANTNKGEEYQQIVHFLDPLTTEKHSFIYWDFYEVR